MVTALGEGEHNEQETERLLLDGARPVLRYLRSQVDTAAQAEELAQETLVRACGRLRERQEREMLAMGPGWEGTESMDDVDRRLMVGEAVESLPPELRVPVLLHYFGDLSVAAVAGHLETTTSAVKMRLLRAR